MRTEVSVDLDVDGAPMLCRHSLLPLRASTDLDDLQLAESYLAQRWTYAIDPVLPLSSAPYSVSGLPGAFRDCEELFRRVVYSVTMHNTDDHLRNHGFIRRHAGWELSPSIPNRTTPPNGRLLAMERKAS